MNQSLRADYPQITATISHVDDAAAEISAAYESNSTNFPDHLPGAQLVLATASADAAFRDRRDLLAHRLFAFVDAADATVLKLTLTDDEYAELLQESLPR